MVFSCEIYHMTLKLYFMAIEVELLLAYPDTWPMHASYHDLLNAVMFKHDLYFTDSFKFWHLGQFVRNFLSYDSDTWRMHTS